MTPTEQNMKVGFASGVFEVDTSTILEFLKFQNYRKNVT